MVLSPLDDNGRAWSNEDIRRQMLRAVADLRQITAQQTDPAKAAEMRGIADRLEMLANEEYRAQHLTADMVPDRRSGE